MYSGGDELIVENINSMRPARHLLVELVLEVLLKVELGVVYKVYLLAWATSFSLRLRFSLLYLLKMILLAKLFHPVPRVASFCSGVKHGQVGHPSLWLLTMLMGLPL